METTNQDSRNSNEKQLSKEEIENLPGNISGQTASPANAGTESRDEDAADDDYAASETSKGFDRDQEELDLGLQDGDLDNGLDTEH
jgi:hypothetical protein